MLVQHEREMSLDVETTGFFYDGDDRVIEIGIVEMINRKPTGNTFHVYINPERDVPEDAYAVHGLSRDDLVRLSGGKVFADVAQGMIDFIGDAPVIAHNASFDINFLGAELARCGMEGIKERGNTIIDTLRLANVMYPGQANNLDALYRRLFGKMPEDRELHGALLDASILAKVYESMTVKQGGLEIEKKSLVNRDMSLSPKRLAIQPGDLVVAPITDEDRELHQLLNKRIEKESKNTARTASLDF